MGVLLWRNFTIDAAMAQCLGNEEDVCTKGRQMPVVSEICDGFPLPINDHSFSISGLRNITSIPSLPRLPLRSLKPPGSATQ